MGNVTKVRFPFIFYSNKYFIEKHNPQKNHLMSKSKDYVYDNLDVFDYVPEYLKNQLNSSMSRNLFNKFLTKEEAIPVYGLIGNKSVSDTDARPLLPQSTTERKINSLIPMIYGKSGTEETVLSFSDIINKARLLGINVADFTDWGSCQSFNFVPPINIDKFINFSSYYWYGKQTNFEPSWNIDLDPEFYVIARPGKFAEDKFPVEVATYVPTILTGSGHEDENWIVLFSDAQRFTVVGEKSNISGSGTVDNVFDSVYLTFKISSGSVPFQAGDTFIISTKDLTDHYSFTYNGVGNGGISGIKGGQQFWKIAQPDGTSVQSYDGMRVLVTAQANPAENGIYIVRSGKWERAEDCLDGSTGFTGIKVFVSGGASSMVGLWEASAFSLTEKTFTKVSEHRNVSEWTEYNFWIHRDDAKSLGIDINNTIQAKRPIIEYSFDLEMNTDQENGKPLGGNVTFNAEQKKFKFNQLPLFNLYLANGEFAERVSSIFYYEESNKSPIDAQMKRRITFDENNDYIFSQGCIDDNGGMLFFKESGIIKSVWTAGPTQAEVSAPLFSSVQRQIEDAEVGIVIENVFKHIKNANWLVTANATTGFTLASSQYSEVKVDVPFDTLTDVFDSLGNRLFSITIPSGSNEIPADGVDLGDYFKFKSVNKEFPRYVTGETLNTSHEVEVDDRMVAGVWTTPFQLEFNPCHENRKTVHFGDLINHFKSIIGAQPGFSGSSFGRNNFRNIQNKNQGLGGKIKEHNGAFNKFVGLINQENISPLSILDFAETQYAQALNSVSEYVNKHAIDFLTSHGTPVFDGNEETTNKIPGLVDEYCDYYENRVDVASYLSDSTSVIPNWPATLPSLGLSGAVVPFFGFDHELGLNVIVHHDGHLSPKNQRNVEFDRGLTKQVVERSDGTSTAGIFSSTMPAKPYKNQLWFHSNTAVLRIFDVLSDSSAPIAPEENDFWYDRGVDSLYQWVNGAWASVDKAAAWKIVETDKILNGFILEIENRLFNSIHPNQQMVWDASQYLTEEALKFELAKFAAKYGYDPYAPDFNNADAFTWNYKEANFPVIGSGISRWYDIYPAYFAQATGTNYPTCRPNIEPWRILGYESMPTGFLETYGGITQVDPSLALTEVSVVLFGELQSPTSAPTSVDGKTLVVGERVLVTSGSNAGIYTVLTVGTNDDGVWTFASDFNPFALQAGQNVSAKNGAAWAGSTWVVVDNNGAKTFEQVRQWKLQLWADIQAAFPTLKLCVNVFNEQLLPPYVDPLSPAAQFGLLNITPTGIANAYEFGDNGPTELVWKKSLEHSYSLLRCSMKNQPLLFIESTWGDVYRSVGGLKIDKQLARKESHKEFLLHGETLPVKNRARIIYSSVLPVTESGEKSVELVCDYVTEFFDFFKVIVDGEDVGHLNSFDQSCGIDFSQLELTDEGFGFCVGDKITFTLTDGVISNIVFESAKTKVYNGLGQLYTQLLKFNSYSLVTSKNSVMFRNWDVNLGYRFGAFMNTETLTLKSNGFDIPLGMCNMLTKISPYAGSSWINAIRIQLVKVGSTQLVDGIYKPLNNGEDWVFRVETYFNKHPEITYYELDTNAEFMTFDVLSGRRCPLTWKNYSKNLSVKTSTVPMIITGVQNVVNFLFGYTRYLQDSGWVINNNPNPDIDAETGRIITWQLEIEKFVDAVYDNLTVGSGVIIDPFMKNVWFKTPKGLVSKFETINFLDVSASQFAFDITGGQIPLDQLKIIREEDTTMVISDTPMFGLHVNVEHYEHCVLFPYYLDNNKKQKLIFDPFLGMKLGKILVQGSRQAVQSARPSFGGFYLSNNKMKRNLVSSVDDLGKLYDSEAVFNNPEYSKYALALFGFSEKEYFESLGTSKRNQFNFWRGMIQAKGTNSSIKSFLNNRAFEDAKIDEYWAFKIAEYGDARTKSFPELKLKASDSLIDTTRFQFADDSNETLLPGFTQVSPKDEARWVNLDDLNELKSRGMYFDATSVGKIIVKEKPQIINLVNEGNGAVKFVSGSQVVKTFMHPTVIRATMNDVDSFTVVNTSTNEVLGTGILGITFSCADFEFQVENDVFEMQAGDSFTFTISIDIESLVKLPFVSDKLVISNTDAVEVISQTVVKVKRANTDPITIEGFGPQKPKFSPIKFFDYKSDIFLGNIPYWNPAIGQHTPEAYEIINMISPVDPAKYNQTTQIVNNPNFDMLKPWGSKEVGKVWWNTNKLDYKPYYDSAFYPNIEHRLSKWGSAAEYSSVDVYEWVESDVPPEKYAEQVLADSKDQNKAQSDKKSGEVAISKLLTRSRTWNVRPIAWKKNEDYDSPFLTSALFNKLKLTSPSVGQSTAILNYGRFTDYSITENMSISAWDFITDLPLGQATVGDTFDYVIGGEYSFFNPSLPPASQVTGGNGEAVVVSFAVDKSKKASSVGKGLGKISITTLQEGSLFYIIATEINTGKSQKLPIDDIPVGAEFVDFDFTELGIKYRLSIS